MNTKNNKRRRESVEKIERAFMELLQRRELAEVTVTDICKMTGLNRSTFYANFVDVYGLADHLREKLEGSFAALFLGQNAPPSAAEGSVRMFRHIYENQIFYRTYFKLGYDERHPVNIYDLQRADADFHGEHIQYHITFFRSGLNAMLKMWLAGGCKESPEEMNDILVAEYRGR